MPRARQLHYESIYLISNSTSDLNDAYKVFARNKRIVTTKLKLTQSDIDSLKRAMERDIKETLDGIDLLVPDGQQTVDVIRIQVSGYFDGRRKKQDRPSLVSDLIFNLVDKHQWDITPLWTHSGPLDNSMKASLRRFADTNITV